MCNINYMRQAISLARLGEGKVSPNPLVGCVVVREDATTDTIISEGWHDHYGGYHAERNALMNLSDDEARGASLYVTLEPCCHHGKTPPCTDIIIEKGISKVYVGSDDPNPLVAGKGIQILRDAGIEVVTHVLKDECDALNEVFFYYITNGVPLVAMKYAMTLDGKIATATGESKWITGDAARAHGHSLRKKYTAILVGIGTILADDPMLNYRGEGSSVNSRIPACPDIHSDSSADAHDFSPIRIILDSKLRIPVESKIVASANNIRTIVAYSEDSSDKKQSLIDKGIELWELPTDTDGRVSVDALMERCGKEGIDSVLVEGGASVHGSFLSSGYVNRVYAYIAPKLVGGVSALSPVGGKGVEELTDSLKLGHLKAVPLGDDVLLTGNVIRSAR